MSKQTEDHARILESLAQDESEDTLYLQTAAALRAGADALRLSTASVAPTISLRTAPEILHEAATTFQLRNNLYGDNYKQFGHIMQVLFPDGLPCRTPDDYNRLGLLVQCISKLTRYAANMREGGHQDSAHDLCVYAAMLEEMTAP